MSKNKYKHYAFAKQRTKLLGIAREIYEELSSNDMLPYVSKGYIAGLIMNQRKPFAHLADWLSDTLEVDDRLVRQREEDMAPFPEESNERMEAGIAFDDEYMEGAANFVGKLTVKIDKYVRLCKELNIRYDVSKINLE